MLSPVAGSDSTMTVAQDAPPTVVRLRTPRHSWIPQIVAGVVWLGFAAMYGWEGRLRGVLGVSMPKVVMPFRRLLAAQASWADAQAHAAALV